MERARTRTGVDRRLLVGLLCALAVLALAFRPVVDGDGVGYYAYLHAVLVRHSLDFTPEYAAAAAAHAGVYPVYVTTRTSTGLLANFYPVGSAVLSAPFYLVALALHPGGLPIMGPPFTTAYVLSSLFWGLVALALCYRLTGSALAVLAVAVASPLLEYLLYDPSYSHTFDAFAVTAFVFGWWRLRDGGGWRGWLLLGLLAGLMALVRPQEIPLAAIALLHLRRARWKVLLLAPGAVMAFAPQLWVDRVLFASWLPAGPPEGFDIWPGHYWQVLFSAWHGLFVWHPVLFLAAIGYWWVPDWRLRVAFLYAIGVETLINGTVGIWWGGFAFGGRRFLDLTPFYAIGLAALARRQGSERSVVALVGLTAWNVLLVANMTYVVRIDVNPGYWGLVRGQLSAVRFLPHLVAQGYVVRALGLGRLVHAPLDVLGGMVLLAAEAACLALAAVAGGILPARLRAAAPAVVRGRPVTPVPLD